MSTRLLCSLAVAAVVLGAMLACGGESQPPFQTHTNSLKGFAITYPTTWKESTFGHGADVEIMPAEEDDPNVFRDNVLVHVETLPKPMALEDYFSLKIDKGVKVMPEYKEIEKGPATLGATEARRLVYSYRHGNTLVTSIAYFTTSGQRGFMVLGSAVSENFQKFKPQLESIIATFKIEIPDTAAQP